MKLIYVWVEKYRNIKERGFELDSNFKVDYEEKKLNIKRAMNKIPIDFFKENINNITGIIGKNGSGKSSLLELISWATGMGNNDINYFLLYHSKDNNYFIEGSGVHLLEGLTKEKYCVKAKTDIDNNIEIFNIGRVKELQNNLIYHIKDTNKNRKPYVSRISTIFFSRGSGNYQNVSYLEKYKYLRNVLKSSDESKYITLNGKKLLKISYLEKKVENVLIFPRKITSHSFVTGSLRVVKTKIKEEDFINWTINYINSLYEKLKIKEVENKEKIEILEILYNKSKPLRKKELWDNNDNLKTLDLLLEEYLKPLSVIIKELQESDELYFYEDFKKIINFFIKLKENFIDDSKNILLDITDDKNEKEIECLLDVFYQRDIQYLMQDTGSEIYKYFDIEIGKYSDGERRVIDIFSQLNTLIGEFYLLDQKEKKNIILLLDEPELSLHPEWKRRFISMFIEEISKFNSYTFQLILTSHSPFIASDLPRENIIMLNTYDKKDKETKLDKDDKKYQEVGNCRVEEQKKLNTFGANIFDLYKEAFFVNSTFGEFAIKKIKEVVKLLSKEVIEGGKIGYNLDCDTFLKKEYGLNEITEEFKKNKKQEIKFIINSIGEKVIRSRLKKEWEEYTYSFFKDKSSNDIIKKMMKEYGLKQEDLKKYINDIGETHD